ncbi:MAG: cobalt-precorrin-6A reductase [Pseudomonadota bacterium]
MRILLLGGTTEASDLAKKISGAGLDAIFSYAGRTASPRSQPLRTRIGGFGGVVGLKQFLSTERITHVIDATHPFAKGMSANAFAACRTLAIPLIRYERAAWLPQPGDRWTHFARIEDCVSALPEAPARVFLAIGKQQINPFARRHQHHYLLRFVDPPQTPPPLVHHRVVVAKGPFDVDQEVKLLRDQQIDIIVAKNSGGQGAAAKLTAARMLRLPIFMVDRPEQRGEIVAHSGEDVMHWLHHNADLGVNTY